MIPSSLPLVIIDKYYKNNVFAKKVLLEHSKLVAEKALEINRSASLGMNETFLWEAAMLHDIGIVFTDAKDIGCYGELPYICHGFKGRELLESEGLHSYALICERHTGMGLSQTQIVEDKLPIPHRDMMPVSEEEKLVCFADKFFSKSGNINEEKGVNKILMSLRRHDANGGERFLEMCEKYRMSVKK
ncbi:MAG: HD domain-containing protein [Bacteroidales bacterium]